MLAKPARLMPVNASPQLAYASAKVGHISCKPAALPGWRSAASLSHRHLSVMRFCASHRLGRLRQLRRHYVAPAGSDDALKAPARRGLKGTFASDDSDDPT